MMLIPLVHRRQQQSLWLRFQSCSRPPLSNNSCQKVTRRLLNLNGKSTSLAGVLWVGSTFPFMRIHTLVRERMLTSSLVPRHRMDQVLHARACEALCGGREREDMEDVHEKAFLQPCSGKCSAELGEPERPAYLCCYGWRSEDL
jgi:hypothetical protein